MTEETECTAVVQAIRNVNRAWTKGQFEDLRDLIDPDIVLAAPGFGERIRGVDAYVSGHRDFVENSTIHSFSEKEVEVDIVRSSAVATYQYTLDYERSGRRYESTGRELFVFELVEGQWRVVWRTILDVSERETSPAVS